MEPVKGLSDLLEALRSRLDALEKTPKAAAVHPRKSGPAPSSEQTLQTRVSTRLRRLSKDDPRRMDKASTIIIRSALASRFGEEVLDDPSFVQLTEDIKRIFVTQPAVRKKIEHLLDSL
jgi:hypothetical protein